MKQLSYHQKILTPQETFSIKSPHLNISYIEKIEESFSIIIDNVEYKNFPQNTIELFNINSEITIKSYNNYIIITYI